LIFHRHRWQEVRRVFVPPVRGIERIRASRETFREALQGVTVVELRCEGCGDVTSRRLPGEVKP
jgi:hypothetical protein